MTIHEAINRRERVRYNLLNRDDKEAADIAFYALERLSEILDADLVSVAHGRWNPYFDHFTKRQIGWICTNCSGVQRDLSNGDTDYCPNCGARMDGE